MRKLVAVRSVEPPDGSGSRIFAMPKSSNFGRPSAEITRLDIAMDHALTVRVVYGSANDTEQRQALGRGKLVRIAIGVDRLAADQLHH